MKRIVNKQGKFNLIDDNGEIVYKSNWLDFLGKYHKGYALIKSSKGWNWIDKKGNLLFEDEWFQYTEPIIGCNICIVKPFNQKWEFRKINGELLIPMTFDYYDSWNEGLAAVYDKQKGWNFINYRGNLISPNMWFDSIDCFKENFGVVFIKNKGYNLIDKQGNLISPNMWFDSIIDYFENQTDCILVKVNNKNYKINKKGYIQNLS